MQNTNVLDIHKIQKHKHANYNTYNKYKIQNAKIITSTNYKTYETNTHHYKIQKIQTCTNKNTKIF